MSTTYQIPSSVSKEIFRAYDIRGIVGANFNDDLVYGVGRALGALALSKNQPTLYLGYDARPSSPGFKKAMAQGLMDSGVNVIDLGIVPSPVLYYATKVGVTQSGVMITGSHNPSEYNGIKMVIDGHTLSSTDIEHLYKAVVEQSFVEGAGAYQTADIVDQYIDDIASRIQLKKPLNVIVDCGNGVAAKTAAKLYKKIGATVTEMYGELDGTFPNHHPDPSVPENLQDLIKAVKEQQADCGLAFDGDADRVGLITETGQIIWPDRMMMLLAQDILQRYPNAPIVYDVKCTHLLGQTIENNGGQAVMAKTGHSLIKNKMKALDAPLAGELSGHIFYQDNWYGFDDGVYVGARLLELIANNEQTVDAMFADFPFWEQTPELKIACREDNKFALVDSLIEYFKQNPGNGELITIDGLRMNYDNGWFLVRASNTTPCLTVRFEAENLQQLQDWQALVKEQLQHIDPSLQIDF